MILVISSSQTKFIEYLEKSLRNPNKTWRLGRNEVNIISINKEEEPLVGEQIVVRSLSPIVAYNTILEGDKKRTKYYGLENDFKITPLKPKMLSKAVVYYKGFVIVGFNGQFKLQGSPILLQLALETGLGGKNAQGFGCIQYIKGKTSRVF